MRRIALGPALLSLLLAACVSGPAGSGGNGRIEHPTGDEAALTIEHRGGFVPIEFAASQTPAFTLLGDGRVFVPGAQMLQFPGPALGSLQVRTLTEDGMQVILAEVIETELFAEDLDLRGATAFVADASDTVFTLNSAGREVSVTVYGLGMLDPSFERPPGVSDAEIAAHGVLTRLQERLLNLDAVLDPDHFADDAWQAYEPDALRLTVRDASAEPPNPELGEQVRAWPSETEPAAFGDEQSAFGDGSRCGVVEGEAAGAWLAELAASSQLTRWSTDGTDRWQVIPRPMLPHEARVCVEGAAAG